MIKNNKKRLSIAKNGRKSYHKKFNSVLVADYIISKTFNINKNIIGKYSLIMKNIILVTGGAGFIGSV